MRIPFVKNKYIWSGTPTHVHSFTWNRIRHHFIFNSLVTMRFIGIISCRCMPASKCTDADLNPDKHNNGMYNIYSGVYCNNYQFTERLSHAYHSQSVVCYHSMYTNIQKYDIKIEALCCSFALWVWVWLNAYDVGICWKNKAYRITERFIVQLNQLNIRSSWQPFYKIGRSERKRWRWNQRFEWTEIAACHSI